MKRANQLTLLIWDFWREDRQELSKLIPLANFQTKSSLI